MPSPLPTISHVPEGHVWRQSGIKSYLLCPRRFELEHVEGLSADHTVTSFAAPKGTAMHGAIARVLLALNAGRTEFRRDWLEQVLADEFEQAVDADQAEGGRTYEPDAVAAAIEDLLGTQLDRLVLFSDDPRIRAVRWDMVERRRWMRDSHGRRYRLTVDAAGTALDSLALGRDGQETAWVMRGEHLIVDWKTGAAQAETMTGHLARSLNLQMGFYRRALAADFPGASLWLGILPDLDRPVRVKDENGDNIPNKVKTLNPAFVEAAQAAGVDPGKTRKRFKVDGENVPKWNEMPNPAYVAACARPKGPLFHRCHVDDALTMRTVSHAVRAAELGIFPASGTLTGACSWCPFTGKCLTNTEAN